MKIGVKTFHGKKFLDYFQDKADFFEVQALQKYNHNYLKKYSIPIVIHAEHFSQGSNPADKTMVKQNLKSINFAIKLADKVNAKKIILHPGKIVNENCSKKQSLKFIKNIDDKRIIIENLTPVFSGLCKTPFEIKQYLKDAKKGFLFDLSHAFVTANHLSLEPIEIIKKFLKLRPKHFHISGQNKDSKEDQHLSFQNKKANLPYQEILKLYPKNAEITLEVTTNIKKTEYDLEFIRRIIHNSLNPSSLNLHINM